MAVETTERSSSALICFPAFAQRPGKLPPLSLDSRWTATSAACNPERLFQDLPRFGQIAQGDVAGHGIASNWAASTRLPSRRARSARPANDGNASRFARHGEAPRQPRGDKCGEHESTSAREVKMRIDQAYESSYRRGPGTRPRRGTIRPFRRARECSPDVTRAKSLPRSGGATGETRFSAGFRCRETKVRRSGQARIASSSKPAPASRRCPSMR